ncbi:putative interleukin-17 receptor E-like isoform X2 [Dunckerocampus dactyliophorus]|uniref:putative interleukin-17 receptor E-like isoform X2 n=1 Tax=Dunckerocampus dactyliophorus TaxID=161453 RepID=UPI002404D116|nr:putative interleukin-17 receptor E-like isoform X2 [Dunckerocampus dactyliophorus]
MFLQAALLMFHSCLGLCGAAAQHMELERIKTCGIKCSQDLQCNTKPAYFFADSCQMPADGLTVSSVFRNLSFSTVMTCEGHQRCSLHLGIHTTVQLPESIHGLSVCSQTPGMLRKCRIVRMSKASRRMTSGMQVELEDNCTDVYPQQQVKVTLTTVPSYCGITQSGNYVAPDCSWKDLRRLVPECITGSLSYDINAERKELRVTVSDMLDDEDYQLRLCHKDFICAGTGANALIMKEEVNKSAILPYFRPLPCLCIEGWSVVTDAPRVQVCPFNMSLEEMWHGIHFDTSAGVLSWEPACPVTATVALCQRGGEDGVCTDLQQASQNVSRGKITFAQVDPHPQLCMKFRAGHQSWIRCPFVGRFQAWDVTVMRHADHKEAKLTSHMNATFSVHACAPSEGPAVCRATGTHAVIYVGAHASVGLNVTDTHSCFYVRRTDVTYAPTILHCLTEERSEPAALFATPANQMLIAVIVPVGLWLTAVIIVTLVLHVRLTDSAPVCDVSQHRDRRSAL